MSYARMDHAGWVQAQIDTAKENARRRLKPRKADRLEAASGKGWLGAPHKLTPFQERVLDILGMVGGGIYNAPILWGGVIWKFGWGGMSVPWNGRRGGLATWDNNHLSLLVLLCHEARIRCSIEPATPLSLQLVFFQRVDRGGIMDRHPNLDEVVALFRAYLPANHRILYRAEPETAEAPKVQEPA